MNEFFREFLGEDLVEIEKVEEVKPLKVKTLKLYHPLVSENENSIILKENEMIVVKVLQSRQIEKDHLLLVELKNGEKAFFKLPRGYTSEMFQVGDIILIKHNGLETIKTRTGVVKRVKAQIFKAKTKPLF